MSRIEDLLQRTRQDVEHRKQSGLASVPADDRRVRWNRTGFRIIAEIKRASLSAGAICPDLDLASLARAYEAAGAVAISVLTESHYFGGSMADLQRAHTAVSLPLLQKDFLIDPFQVHEAKAGGASFVLLIARFLSRQELRGMLAAVREMQLNAIVEVTDGEDLAKLDEPVEFLGVNARNLQTLEMDTGKFENLRSALPDAFLIAESGINTPELLERVIGLGYHGALIGEHFLRAADPAKELSSFVRTANHRPSVKICGITNETDALQAVESGADALGFIFAESPRRIDPRILAAIRPKIPAGILCAGVFLGQTQREIEDTVRRFDLHLAQVYDDAQPGVPVWIARRIHSPSAVTNTRLQNAVLWDVKSDDPLNIWKSLAQEPVFALAGGLHPGNVTRAAEICRPVWVDVARGVEREPGVKDPAKLREFMKALR